mgnify:CR=1 FL=1
MGYAKYHEDDLEIYEERMLNKESTAIQIPAFYTSKPIVYNEFCPLCHKGFEHVSDVQKHVYESHGKKSIFIFLNGWEVKSSTTTVNHVFSLFVYCFNLRETKVEIIDNFGNSSVIVTRIGVYEYDITKLMRGKLYSNLKIIIEGKDRTVEIKQFLDMNNIHIEKILARYYVSALFDERISDDEVSVKECLNYLKMLINEGEDTEPFIYKVEENNYDENRDLTEVYYYYYLNRQALDDTGSIIDHKKMIIRSLIEILNTNYERADGYLANTNNHDNDYSGCLLIMALLKNDKLSVDFNLKKYKSYGIIGDIISVMLKFRDCDNNMGNKVINEIDELQLFSHYPVVGSLINLNAAMMENKGIDEKTYNVLKMLSPMVCILYCNTINDRSDIEKIIKSNIKIHGDSILLKNYAVNKDYRWVRKKLTVRDRELYRTIIDDANKKRSKPFSKNYLDNFPYDDQISITPLGGEYAVGASCFVISYMGYNIMLDTGINPNQKGDNTYPALDLWKYDIDIIVISHAHLDHCGAIAKAHAMWPSAPIVMTEPTRIQLKYILYDMAKTRNEITSDYEIENIKITEDAMKSAYESIQTIHYKEAYRLSHDIELRFHRAGHIVGAVMVELIIAGKTILYTSDYTDFNQTLVKGAHYSSLPHDVDYLITEATYAGKHHNDLSEQINYLKQIIINGISQNKSILLPAAAIGRSQELVCMLGQMKLKGELPPDVKLIIGGMAIPSNTQLIPFFNEMYEKNISCFEELEEDNYPCTKAIVVASSGNMSRGSASYKVAQHWKFNGVKHMIITSRNMEDYGQSDYWNLSSIRKMDAAPLVTHTSEIGILRLIENVSPKLISFVHFGGFDNQMESLVTKVRKQQNNDVEIIALTKNNKVKIFNLYENLMEGN